MRGVIQPAPGRPGRINRQPPTGQRPMAGVPTHTVALATAGIQQVPPRVTAPPGPVMTIRAAGTGPRTTGTAWGPTGTAWGPTGTACGPTGTAWGLAEAMRRTGGAPPDVRATGAGVPITTLTAIPDTRGTATLATGVTVRLAMAATVMPQTGATVEPATGARVKPHTVARTSPERTLSPGGSAAGCVSTVLAARLAMGPMAAGLLVPRATVIAATGAAAAERAATDPMAMRATGTRAAIAAAATGTAGALLATGAPGCSGPRR